MKDETKTSDSKKGGAVPSRQAIYNKLSVHSNRAIEKLVELLDSRNENIRLGAINKILDKTIPDIKAVELTGELGDDGKRKAIQLFVNAGGGFIPSNIQLSPTSVGGSSSSTSEVQSTGMASTSTENNNSNSGDSQASSS